MSLVTKRTLHLTPPTAPPVEDLGALLDCAEIADRIWRGKVSRRWVVAHLPERYHVWAGNKLCAHEAHARAWLAEEIGLKKRTSA